MASSDWHEALPGSNVAATVSSTGATALYEPVDVVDDQIRVDIPTTLTSHPARPSSKAPAKGFLVRMRRQTSKLKGHPWKAEDEAVARLPRIQARVRGKLARAQLVRDAQAASMQCFTPSISRILLLGPPFVLILLILSPWLLPLCLLAYVYLRLPYILGWILSECTTRFAMFNYPIRFGAVHLSPWLRLDKGMAPLLKVRLLVEDFALSNPPSLCCRSADFVSVGQTSAVIAVDLGFVAQLLRTGMLRPITFHFESCSFQRARLIFELRNSRLNVNEMLRELAEREVRAALPSAIGARLRCMPPARCKMPNVLRIKLLAVRGLVKRSNKPYIVVRARDARLATSRGELVQTDSAAGEEWRFADELLLRITDPSTVVDMRVFSSQGRDQCVGRWVMTMKYLITLPTYCKHKAPLSQDKNGCISGTFLLADHGLRGSAMRSLGAHEVGDGLCGEIDMRLHWLHDSELPTPSRTDKTAIAHLKENKAETLMRMGNLRELRELLRRLPIRIRSRSVVLRDVEVGALACARAAGGVRAMAQLLAALHPDFDKRPPQRILPRCTRTSVLWPTPAPPSPRPPPQVSIKDIFSGHQGHVESKMQKEVSLSQRKAEEEIVRHRQLADKRFDVVKVKQIELSSVSDMDCGGFLESLLIDQLVPAILKQMGSIGYQTLGTILGGVGMNMSSISKSVVRKSITSARPSTRNSAVTKAAPLFIQQESSN